MQCEVELRAQIDQLKEATKKSEDEKSQIVQLAHEVLEKNNAYAHEIASLKSKIEKQHEKISQKTHDVCILQTKLRKMDEHLTDIEYEASFLKEELDCCRREKIELEKRCNDLSTELQDRMNELMYAEGRNSDLYHEIELRRNMVNMPEESTSRQLNVSNLSSAGSEQCTRTDSEFRRILEQMMTLKEELAKHEVQRQNEIYNREIIQRNLDQVTLLKNEMETMLNEALKDSKELYKRSTELSGELHGYKFGTEYVGKGNSMFKEFVDERVKLERSLIELKSGNDRLKAEIKRKDREISTLNIQVSHLSKRRSDDDQEMLNDCFAEIVHLRNELNVVRKSAKLTEEKPSEAQLDGNERYSCLVQTQFIALQCAKSEIMSLKASIDTLYMERSSLFDKYSRLFMKSTCKIQQLEEDIEKYKNKNTEVDLTLGCNMHNLQYHEGSLEFTNIEIINSKNKNYHKTASPNENSLIYGRDYVHDVLPKIASQDAEETSERHSINSKIDDVPLERQFKLQMQNNLAEPTEQSLSQDTVAKHRSKIKYITNVQKLQ